MSGLQSALADFDRLCGTFNAASNLPAHKAAGVREAIEARGAVLRYLPQYSPDLNPIEMPFSKLKDYLRKMAERTITRCPPDQNVRA